MDDLEITTRCAVAMGYRPYRLSPDGVIQECGNGIYICNASDQGYEDYYPLVNGAQCFALVKRFRLDIAHCDDGTVNVFHYAGGPKAEVEISDADLNRAICLCIARLPAQQPADAAGER